MNTLSEVNCSKCNSLQKFSVRFREVEGRKDGVLEAFTRCRMCLDETILYLTTKKIERLRERLSYSRVLANQGDAFGARMYQRLQIQLDEEVLIHGLTNQPYCIEYSRAPSD